MQITRYEATGHHRGSRDRERIVPGGIKRGPLAFMSLGTFMMIVWLVMLLPGQDIATWQREQQRLQAANDLVDPTICLPALTPQSRVAVHTTGRSHLYHWRENCPILAPRRWSSAAPFRTITFAQALHRHLYPCSFCNHLDHTNPVSSPR